MTASGEQARGEDKCARATELGAPGPRLACPPGGRDLVMSARGSASQNTSGHRCRRRPRSKNQKSTCGDFGAPHCSCFFSYSYSATRYSYSYSKSPSIAIRPIGPQVPANRFDQRTELPQFKQPSSTSTVSLSTASLSTSTTKSDARHERYASPRSRHVMLNS